MDNEKNLQNGKKPKRHKPIAIICLSVISVMIICALWCISIMRQEYDGDDTCLYIPRGATDKSIADTLRMRLGDSFGNRVYDLWKLRNRSPAKSNGAYIVKRGMSVMDVSRKLISGAQDPIRLTFNNLRTLDQLAERVGDKLELTPYEFLEACDSVLIPQGLNKNQYPAAFMPDTYEFYWNASPLFVVKTLNSYRNRFWTDERKARAESLGLSPEDAATLASIVEEETVKSEERPKVARLYLNRLEKGMKLQADPTVKFGIGDFSIRRITGKHLDSDSPYNTYKYVGLPPGPIRIPDGRTIDAVLNAPAHNYIYMCAKEDFSGYHNFAVSSAEHMANARRYHRALNKRGVK